MKLSAIGSLPSFALLGPGFTGSAWTLYTHLRPDNDAPSLVYLPYEALAQDARRFAGLRMDLVEPEFDTAAIDLSPTLDTTGFEGKIGTIRDAIARGDVYQVNLTLRARTQPATGAEMVSTLCRRGVPRFFAWVRLPGGFEFVSASPELFFEISGDVIHSEPMKGTAMTREALLASAKDAAELAMITDLVRNDLARICVPRSVCVADPRRFVELPYAVQTVSDVEGMLAPGWTYEQVLAALHPAGSITGAPKSTACELISALEPSARGAYCGTLGHVEGQSARFSLLIRTATRSHEGWEYGVGAGITWSSVAADELAEIRLKLGALGGGR